MDRLVFERMNEQEAVHWWFVARRDLIRTTIKRVLNLPAKAEILEAGCGTGGNLELLQKLGTLDAFEYDHLAREIASGKSKLEVAFGALPNDIPFGQKPYDMIAIFDVLEHIEDDVAALRELGTRLKAEGKVFVTVPALPWLWSPHDERHHHFRRYTGKRFRQTAQAAGLRVEKLFYFNSFLLPFVIGLRLVKTLIRSQSADDNLPAAWLNKLLYKIFTSERHLIGRVRMPIGLSIAAILIKGP